MVDPNGMEATTWEKIKENLSLRKILENNAKAAKDLRDDVSRGARGAARALGGGETAQDVAEAVARTPTKMIQSGIEFFDPVKNIGGLVESVRTKGVEGTVVESMTAPYTTLTKAKQALASGDIAGAADAAGDFLFLTYTMAVGGAAKTPTPAGKGASPGMAPALAGGGVLAGAGGGLGSLPLVGALEGTALGGLLSMMTGDDEEPADTPESEAGAQSGGGQQDFFTVEEALADALKRGDVPKILQGGEIGSIRRLGSIGPVKSETAIKQLEALGYDPSDFRAVQYEVVGKQGGSGVFTVFEAEEGVYFGGHWSSKNY